MKSVLLVALGGAIGALGRFGLGALSQRLSQSGALRALPEHWPTGTFAANLLGGLAIGMFVEWAALRAGAHNREWMLFVVTGVLGGFTTFSAFSLEIVRMMRAREHVLAASYVGLSVALAVGAVMIGMALGRRLFA